MSDNTVTPGSGLDLDNPNEIKQSNGPVECFGKSFANDAVRREYYLAILAEKLKDPEFRKIEGFPIGEDDDILELSDPPYYTACPNPFIREFIEFYGRPYDPAEIYNREPYASDVSEGKQDPVYKAHSYHTKVPHKAIMRYLMHYTNPGDLVFDGFCGTGMTGVAAQMCGDKATLENLGYKVDSRNVVCEQGEGGKWKEVSSLGSRKAILSDLSPIAGFISQNYNAPIDIDKFEREAKELISQVEKECGWLYSTTHTDGMPGRINYTVWSDVLICPECSSEIIFWEKAVDKESGSVRELISCSNCNTLSKKKQLEKSFNTTYDPAQKCSIKQVKQIPVLIYYSVGSKRFQKIPDADDLALIEKIDGMDIPYWYPSNRMPEGKETRRNDPSGITHVHHFYTKRNLWVLALLDSKIESLALRFVLTGIVNRSTKMNRIHLKKFFFGGGGWNAGYLKGTLYISSIPIETSIFEQWEDRLSAILRALRSIDTSYSQIISTQSSTSSLVSDESVDYIFIDPPFGANLNYSELSSIWESWLKISTNDELEAIENSAQGKGLDEYRYLMARCFKDAYRILKPGRWITVEFSNTKASVWNSIQTSLTETGFIIANVSGLDKKQGSFKSVNTPTAVKQDFGL